MIFIYICAGSVAIVAAALGLIAWLHARMTRELINDQRAGWRRDVEAFSAQHGRK